MWTNIATYLAAKRTHKRKRTADIGGKAFDALEIATRVLRMHYPWRRVRATRVYYNNTPIESFLAPERPAPRPGESIGLCKSHIVVDVYFLFGDDAFRSRNETDSFVVEVAFPVGARRKRWACMTRVRWADLGWKRMGGSAGDMPISELTGESFVSDMI